MHHKDQRRIDQIKRYMLAEQSMTLAIAACDALLNRSDDLSGNEKCVMQAGLVTLYVSPFTEAQNLGTLEDDFTRFPEVELKEIHDAVFVYRNCFIAHRDLSNPEVQVHIGDKKAPFYTPQILVQDNGAVLRQCPFMYFDRGQIEKIRKLAAFQLERISKKANKLMDQLIGRNQNKLPGSYILGVTYP
jgi:hypothetical protein